MKRIGDIDAFNLGRPIPSDKERENSRRDRLAQQRENGYQQLAELCRLGEYDAAKRLANQNPRWGYEIVSESVIERED